MGKNPTLENSIVHVKCSAGCGFVVHDRYFEDKTQFSAGICARCNAPVQLVKPFTDEVAASYKMDSTTGRISKV